MPYLFTFLFSLLFLWARPCDNVFEKPIVHTLNYRLGSKTISLVKTTYGKSSKPLFVHLHHNETSAETAALAYAQQNGGSLLRLLNGGRRNISFKLNGKTYTFDPNRMFSRQGIRASLNLYGTASPKAIAAVEGFAQFVLRQLNNASLVVAMHNNSHKNYSVLSYHNGSLQKSAAKVWIDKKHDIDNFFLTTKQSVYSCIKDNGHNVVLQSSRATDDGSLSVYFGRRNKRYINIETQMGQSAQQLQMIKQLMSCAD